MNPVPWLQMTNMISYQGLVRTFPIPAQGSIGLFVRIFEPRGRIGGAGFERISQPQSWLPQGLAAASVPEHLILDVLL